ncbi:MAG: hypothetical protein P4L73_09235 [Caulobacteraceae bacterium]|nr:hypothetical protein [Caulobacteraceae bacterium]
MSMKSILIAGAALVSLAAPAAAFADPYWGGGDHGGYHDGWRGGGDGWREHEWREHEARERGGWGAPAYGYGYGWSYAPRCYVESRGHYTWYGEYVYQPVRVCR